MHNLRLIKLTFCLLWNPSDRFASVVERCSCVVSFTTDLGTESGLADVVVPSIRSALPFTCIPFLITVWAVMGVGTMVNAFPTKGSISATLSPMTIMTGEVLDYKKQLAQEERDDLAFRNAECRRIRDEEVESKVKAQSDKEDSYQLKWAGVN